MTQADIEIAAVCLLYDARQECRESFCDATDKPQIQMTAPSVLSLKYANKVW